MTTTAALCNSFKTEILAMTPHTAADVYPGDLRAYLQSRFGGGGQGYVPLVRPSKFYRPTALTLESSRGWKVEHAQTREGRDDGYYGLMGASASSKAKKKKEFTRVIPVVASPAGTTPAVAGSDGADARTTYDFYYLRQPGGGRFKLKIDGKEVATISTKAKEFAPGYQVLTRPGGPHTVEVLPQGDGEVRLFGMVVENDKPGVVVDTLGIGGTRAANQLKWKEHVWSDNLRRRAPEMLPQRSDAEGEAPRERCLEDQQFRDPTCVNGVAISIAVRLQ